MDDIVNRKSKYYGKLTPECLKDLDALLIRMRLINRKNARKKVIRMSDIVSLPDGDYIRLWGYIRHCCQLATSWPNVRKSISVVAEKSGREFHDVMAECRQHDYTRVHVRMATLQAFRGMRVRLLNGRIRVQVMDHVPEFVHDGRNCRCEN